MKTDLKKRKNIFLFKLMNNSFFQKWMEKVKEHRDIVTIERMRNYLVSQPHYHTTKFVSNGKKKTEILMNKPVCLGLSILELNKI